jgi:hypothetical protein
MFRRDTGCSWLKRVSLWKINQTITQLLTHSLTQAHTPSHSLTHSRIRAGRSGSQHASHVANFGLEPDPRLGDQTRLWPGARQAEFESDRAEGPKAADLGRSRT